MTQDYDTGLFHLVKYQTTLRKSPMETNVFERSRALAPVAHLCSRPAPVSFLPRGLKPGLLVFREDVGVKAQRSWHLWFGPRGQNTVSVGGVERRGHAMGAAVCLLLLVYVWAFLWGKGLRS